MAKFEAEISANVTKFISDINSAINKAQDFGDKMQSIGTKLSLALTVPLTAAGTAAFKMAADMQDSLGATDQIFKSSSSNVKEWAKNMETYFGISTKEALEYSNMMGSMLKNIGGLTDAEAQKQSAKLIELAGDLTAMYGGTTADAVRALTGALKGNNTMLDNYGMAANDALVKAKALELGIASQGKEMTLAAKQAATLALIYEQSGAAQGQAAREAEGASGSIRALQTEVTNLSTELGSNLLPAVTSVINFVKNATASFRGLTPEMQKTIVIAAAVAAAIGPVLIGLGTLIKLAPLVGTAFTLMTGPIGIVTTALAASAIAIYTYWDDIKKVVINSVSSIQSAISSVFGALSGAAGAVGLSSFSNELKKLSGEFKFFSNNTKQEANEIGSAIKSTTGAVGSLTTSLSDSSSKMPEVTQSVEELKKKAKELADTNRNVLRDSLSPYQQAIFDIDQKYKDILSKTNDLATIGLAKANKQAETFRAHFEIASVSLDKMLSKISGGQIKELKLNFDTSTSMPNEINDVLRSGVYDRAISSYGQLGIDSGKAFSEGLGQFIEEAIETSLIDLSASIGSALGSGGNVLKAAGASLLGSLGSIMVDLGSMAIKTGIAIEAVKKALQTLSGPVAIAAGIGLVAIGSAFKSGASKIGGSMGSGGGYSSSAGSVNSNVIRNDMGTGRLYNNDKQVVELKLKNTELVGAMNLNSNRNNRLS